ncbi:hypothetical protein D3C85_912960 [compost metagenome]
MVIPAIAQQYAYGIFTLVNGFSNIISYIECTPVETGVHRIHAVVTNLFSVDG